MSQEFFSTCRRMVALAGLLAGSIACGSSEAPRQDASPSHDAAIDGGGPADASGSSELREDVCTYWPLEPGPSCGEEIFGSETACIEALSGCEDSELTGIGYCWESGDDNCEPGCLPECAEEP